MKTKLTLKLATALVALTSLAIITLILLFLADGFFDEKDSDYTSNYISDYTYQSEGEYITYEISHVPKGYENSIYEFTVSGLSEEEKQAIFDKWRQREDLAEEYEEARAIAESDTNNTNDFAEAEEARIEEYCDEEGFLSCYNIKYTCSKEYKCHLVTITCEDTNYEPMKEINWGKKYSCDEWKVSVNTDSFDIREVSENYWEGYGYQC